MTAKTETPERVSTLRELINEVQRPFWREAAHSRLDELERETIALRSRLERAEKALREFAPSVCPVCGGDCSAANPPVTYCPVQIHAQALKEAEYE